MFYSNSIPIPFIFESSDWLRLLLFCLFLFQCSCLPRMTGALNALLENPQNNMRIFREGQSLYCGGNRQWFDDDLLSIHLNTLFDDRCGCVEGAASCDNRNRSKFIALIARALLAEFRDNCPEWVSMEQQFIDQTATKSSERLQLPERCVLNRVLNVQKMLAVSYFLFFFTSKINCALISSCSNAFLTGIIAICTDHQHHKTGWHDGLFGHRQKSSHRCDCRKDGQPNAEWPQRGRTIFAGRKCSWLLHHDNLLPAALWHRRWQVRFVVHIMPFFCVCVSLLLRIKQQAGLRAYENVHKCAYILI